MAVQERVYGKETVEVHNTKKIFLIQSTLYIKDIHNLHSVNISNTDQAILISGPLVWMDEITNAYTVYGVASMAPRHSEGFKFSATYTRTDDSGTLQWLNNKINNIETNFILF